MIHPIAAAPVLQTHLALRTERYIRQGMPADEARNRARCDFGRITQLKEDLRESRGILVFETALPDIRYSGPNNSHPIRVTLYSMRASANRCDPETDGRLASLLP